MLFKKKSKEKTAQYYKSISTKNLFIAECVIPIRLGDHIIPKHYPTRKWVLVRNSNNHFDSEKYYTDIFTGTNYYNFSNPFAEIGSIAVGNLMPLNIPYSYITYELAREILQKANSQED